MGIPLEREEAHMTTKHKLMATLPHGTQRRHDGGQ